MHITSIIFHSNYNFFIIQLLDISFFIKHITKNLIFHKQLSQTNI